MRLFLIGSVLLSGCVAVSPEVPARQATTALPTTAAELRLRPPTATYRTAKSPAMLGQCLVDRFPLLNRFAAVEAGNRHTLQFNENGVMRMLVDLQDNGTMTLWRLLPYDADARAKVEGCL